MSSIARPTAGAVSLLPSLSVAWPAGRAPRVALQGTAFMLALLVPFAAAGLIDGRTLNDISVWVKPSKFAVSLALHFATIGLLLGLVERGVRDGIALRGLTLALVAAGIGEIAYIALQAARGRASHFNLETPAEAMAYSVMGGGAVVLVVVPVVLGFMIAFRGRADIGTGLRLGAVIGLVGGGLLTLATAGVLSAGVIDGPGHWVGGVRSDAGGLPIFGWSRTGGDLRVAHFFATHGLQALPIVGLVADRLAPGRARTLVLLATAGWVLVVAGTFAQAVMGLPLLPV
jgi:hypothetical protein